MVNTKILFLFWYRRVSPNTLRKKQNMLYKVSCANASVINRLIIIYTHISVLLLCVMRDRTWDRDSVLVFNVIRCAPPCLISETQDKGGAYRPLCYPGLWALWLFSNFIRRDRWWNFISSGDTELKTEIICCCWNRFELWRRCKSNITSITSSCDFQ